MFEKILASVRQIIAVPNILAVLLALYGIALMTQDASTITLI